MELWNLGAKVRDVGAEMNFLAAAGCRIDGSESIAVNDREITLNQAFIGNTRILLFDQLAFEHALPSPLATGWSHAVFEVSELNATLDRFIAAGATLITPEMTIRATFGKRTLAFIRTPGGLVIELCNTHKSE